MSRRGYSIIEVLVVMGLMSVVMTVGVGMLRRVMHEQKSVQRDCAMHRVAERLSAKLREDVHLAIRAELIQSGDQGEQSLVLKQPGEITVTYAVRSNVVQWAAVGKSELTHRDRFRFPENYQLRFSDVSAGRVTFTAYAFPQAYLAMANDGAHEQQFERDVLRAVMHVEVSVGRDHRFSSQTTRPGES